MKKFLKVFALFFICYLIAYLFQGITITGPTVLKAISYAVLIAFAYLFFTSAWWKKHVLKLKNDD
ncbi:hypothetical protein [Serratia quinivorans]|uniref:hypothetical protein n=1 Tax=Serratia quinivorans TaxID=137545 RepID=UPI0021777A82|nr:hypothetical protein [Serratia quinivorans]CAI0993380.1 Uncharacterised protein [Serratia quinivorans]CAI1050136.1 Uncharacterised protein [Serratia quinivorans]CAI1195871.1 Uncharacterised protein [Serratia quinivorans]CAI1861761.1 Uncharacterised protein [Serratia quinivorans]CAI2110807.1 Uncharacterised protein [Serratia quinivorans]